MLPDAATDVLMQVKIHDRVRHPGPRRGPVRRSMAGISTLATS